MLAFFYIIGETKMRKKGVSAVQRRRILACSVAELL